MKSNPYHVILFSILVITFQACGNGSRSTPEASLPATDTIAPAKDHHTQSNADSILLKHLDLNITVDFSKKQIRGSATWQIENPHDLKELKLDTYDLTIEGVTADDRKVSYTKGPTDSVLGTALHIPVTPETRSVTIYYKTGQNATALKWLEPQQTADKKHPFLYTQSQSIYARTWLPCADGPGFRYTYTARVNVPKGMMALMSAENSQQVHESGAYTFKMDIPVPAYLMALAVGDISFRAVDERTGVYAEPSMLDKAHHELADLGKMVHTAEQLYGPYRWGRYDVLILPPSFPIGGMENPKLTFATPTIIAGDRSLINLIAHELAHNWSGNLVTNATWEDIWMNEGFTVYFERRITEAMTDKSYVDMLWELGYQDLDAEVQRKGAQHRNTWLKQDLSGVDADEGLSDIPYEKGALFLWLIERNVGRERFDTFLRQYFDEYAFKTITTEQFLSYMDRHLIKGDGHLKKLLNIQAWVYGPGIPSNAPRADKARFGTVNMQRRLFVEGNADPKTLNTKNWSTHEWLFFLRKMPKPLSYEKMAALDQAFGFSQTGNSEIACLWYIMSVSADYTPAYPAMETFLSHVGRRKFLEPLYREMMETGKQEMANSLYKAYRNNYHPMAQASLDRVIYQ